MKQLREAIARAAKKLYGLDIEPDLSRPEEQFGDFSTNAALQVASQTGKPSREIAGAFLAELKLPQLAKAQIAGPGFINFWLTDEALADLALQKVKQPKQFDNQSVVVEYSDPNPFKVLHVGHLYTSVVGDAIANLFEAYAAKVHRVNFGGDVGLHVAKTMWAILHELKGENADKLNDVSDKPQWLADCYVAGNLAYEKDSLAKQEIEQLNQKIYQIVETDDKQSLLAKIYWTTRQWSYDYFDEFYKRIKALGFEKYYPESQTVELGLQAVKDNIGKVFEKSKGAIVFNGEVHNMHTRVFVNSQGLPTYETKDVGLILKKWQDYHFDRSIVITGNEIYEYMQVVLKAVEQFAPDLVKKTTHITHGLVKLPGSQKMSSRLGNIITAESVLEMARQANKELNKKDNEDTALGAVKYAFLKQRLGADIIYDPAESVSLEGNSGPYLQYAYVRANSILHKVESEKGRAEKNSYLSPLTSHLEPAERSLLRKISQYPEAVDKAMNELLPHHVCTYLYELAQEFNRFYEKNRVIGDQRQGLRLTLVEAYADRLKSGLELLNIPAPERM